MKISFLLSTCVLAAVLLAPLGPALQAAAPTALVDGNSVAIKALGLTTVDSPHGPALVSTATGKDAVGEIVSPALGKDGAPFSIEAWFYVSEHKNPNTLLMNRGRQNCWQIAVIADGRPWVTLWTSQTETFMLPAKNAVSENMWHHVALNKHEDGLVELYIDGKFSAAKTMDVAVQSIAQPTRVLPQGFSGQIADIRINNGKTIPETRLEEIRKGITAAAKK